MVLDLRLPDMSGFEVLERIRDEGALRDLPVVVFTGKELSPEEENPAAQLWRAASWSRASSRPSGCSTRRRCSCTGSSPTCRPTKQQMLDRLHRSDEDLPGKKVLVVDDDVRNIFALSSVLERRGMDVLTAETGREAIELLRGHRPTSRSC